ncbi:MAG: glutamyl-tRNA reductase [Fibrobacter sp.]|uniref:glutamyl-tRNA reductase n=1 Tax=Fibrobacter sp. TaxID=35828 RepID=UPI001B1DD343|nr:glutamyl-tRNA reductase [Fibrobacter sp.]MBO7061695.1 glutamyl-tRNA reductase [Fibrobacter sp.]
MRKIYMAGMSHKVAEIAVREKFYIPMDVKSEALAHSPFDELLILATCNRTEVYVASDRDIGEAELVRYVCDLARQSYEDFAKFFYFKSGDEVAHHVMNVCAGLDSVAVGEDQILHQIGRAYETALKFGATGNSLNKLFQGAIHTTKRIKTETNLSKLSCNIPFLAMKQVQHSFDDLENRTVYIVGLGEMGSLMLKYVQENTTKIFASSRTFANAQKFADVLTPVKFEDRYQVLGQCDVVILCSACQEPIVTKKDFAEAIGGADANKAARLVIDLGSPRNAEASIGELPGVQYVCVDDLEKIVSENRRLRMVELEAAQKILKEGLDEFLQWYRMDDIAKEIHLLAEKTVQSADMECEKLLRSLPEVSEVDRSRIQMMYVRFAKKMVNEYLYKVKECNPLDDVRTYLKCLRGGK